MPAVTLSTKYQLVIPKEIREALDLRPGQKIQVFREGNLVTLVPVRPIQELRGMARGMDTTVEREEDRV
jgi:AbrB family looped-hinge helix DNA binding protein